MASRFIQNPYAARASKKRTGRPWESNQPKLPTVASGFGSLSTPADISADSKASTSKDEFDAFDCDIDWDAAARLVDQVEQRPRKPSSARSSPQSSQSTCGPYSFTTNEMHKRFQAQAVLSTQDPFELHSKQALKVGTPKLVRSVAPASCSSTSKTPIPRPTNTLTHSSTKGTNGIISNSRPSTLMPIKNCHKTFTPTRPLPFDRKSHHDSTEPIHNASSVTSLPPQKGKVAPRDTLLSMRPESWASGARGYRDAPTSTQHPQKSNHVQTPPSLFPVSSRPIDPRQASLPRELAFDPAVVGPVEDKLRQKLVKNADLSSPLLNGWTLYSHQKKAILCGIIMRRMILALDMGLGKTLIGCVWSKAFVRTLKNLKVVVICPVSIKTEWKRTAEAATGLTVREGAEYNRKGECDAVVVSWAKVPPKIDAEKYVVVADEAHSMQSMKSARTKSALSLMESSACMGVLLLSGTPMKNGKPSNLFPLLRGVRHPLGRHQKAFETHFCDGRDIRLGGGPVIWSANGATNVGQLRELAKSHLLHLTKETCLKNLPPQTRQVQEVPVSPRMNAKHQQALNELAKVYEASQLPQSIVGKDAVLGAIQRLRMVSSLAKIDAAVSLATSVLQNQPAVVVFTSFCDVAKSIHRRLIERGHSAELLTGETPQPKRQVMVDNFQCGVSAAFVCTFGAGGVGLTLTAAHTVILVDRPWTPGEAHQAEDRVRRIGQTKAVTSIWISAFELDKQIDELLDSKSQTSTAVLAGSGDGAIYQQQHESIIPLILKTVLGPCKASANID